MWAVEETQMSGATMRHWAEATTLPTCKAQGRRRGSRGFRVGQMGQQEGWGVGLRAPHVALCTVDEPQRISHSG